MREAFVYNSAAQTAGRNSTLWICKDGELYSFSGKSIRGVVEVTGNSPVIKDTKGRPASIYRLKLAEGAVPCVLISSMHGRLWPDEGLEAARKRVERQFALEELSPESFVAAMMRDFPLTANRMGYGEEIPSAEDWERSNRIVARRKKLGTP
ncbi:MAG: hypothetical protein UY31_C0018G0007 [Candidatus Wolfebacteria bacterium GW2011_GWE1_48_7]|uniref:Uncharacterized protein n=2 Tax=Candidatus Wolfeibacteriota TaxID=1752735 RepID=A0A0G1U8V7_9BACT|nr:MAG: hypothetical protein UX70_C0001G0837 [Candidatus Wolfebacteria bacterium GW2011_GWB1_47_1]KKU36277.1 MAG: hypothetical protein UX49_C0019G0023 [Candidatus Wolfebacteria bacterium GW2011_GWC2_46_275]KKU42124.1 MAG: hypothetical protein UX58_C0003G0048 [Candidatus Wolfebacteria bacterium GW2011_GWB2_46_69]KKU54100.1 MAG: hypothetical protein UX76_C0006G0066 [Candidatus Wolfebacteria bacterium GW2011_GWC1_47_103]KKU59287.1 MAG: hypothetical protein UX83_C0006G0057 [Candidatus Wolfebacteria